MIQIGNNLIGLVKDGGMQQNGYGGTLAWVLMMVFSLLRPDRQGDLEMVESFIYSIENGTIDKQ